VLSLPNQTIRMVIQIRSLPVPIHSGEGELTAGQLNLKQRLNMQSFPDEVLAYRRCGSNIRVLNGVVSRINFTYITLAHPSTSVRTQGSVPAAGDTRTHGQVRHSRDCYAA